MKRVQVILLLAVVASLAIAGTASAVVDWGKYLGYPIARIQIDGQVKNPSNPAIIIQGRTYVPLRYISENLGAGVDWDQSNRTVIITSSNTVPPTTTTTVPQSSYQYPPITKTDQGLSVTINSVQAGASSTIVNVTATNNSSVDINFATSLTQIVAGSTQINEPTDYNYEAFGNDLHPGVTRQGDIVFPALPSGSGQIKVYFTAFTPALDSIKPIFNVQL